MGGALHFTRLNGVGDEGLGRGAKILDLSGLEDHVESSLSSSLNLSTLTRKSDYPKYEYLLGLYYDHDGEPLGGEAFFVDNVYPDDYADIFEGISEYTEPFVTIAARSFPRTHSVFKGTMRDLYVIYAEDGESRQVTVEDPFNSEFEEVVETKLLDEELV